MTEISYAELTHLDVIQLTGQDTLKFLQGQCTQDVMQLKPNQPMAGAFCNAKGRMISNVQLVLVNQEPTEVLMICHKSSAEALFNHLKKYAAFFRGMKLNYASDAYRGFGISGLEEVSLASTQEQFTTSAVFGWDAQRAMLWQSSDLELPEFAAEANDQSLNEWQAQDIQSQKLWLDSDQIESWIPQNVSLDELDGISFKKGCYTGQEVIARLHFKGQSKKRLFALTASSDKPFTDSIYNGEKAIGQVIQRATVGQTQFALAVLPTTASDAPLYLDENQQVEIQLLH